jgi:hypothetical protein
VLLYSWCLVAAVSTLSCVVGSLDIWISDIFKSVEICRILRLWLTSIAPVVTDFLRVVFFFGSCSSLVLGCGCFSIVVLVVVVVVVSSLWCFGCGCVWLVA